MLEYGIKELSEKVMTHIVAKLTGMLKGLPGSSTMSSEELLAKALREAAAEAKRADKQQHKAEEARVIAEERRNVASSLIEQRQRTIERKRHAAEEAFKKMPLPGLPVDVALAHWEECRKTSPWMDWEKRKASIPSEYRPVPSHPVMNTTIHCPACVAMIWKKCYDEAADD